MPVLNTIRQFIDTRGISRYRFWQDTGLGRDTAYRLCNDPSYVPTGNVLDKICATYRVQPGELLTWIPDDYSSQEQNIVNSASEESNTESTNKANSGKRKVQSAPPQTSHSEATLKIIFGSKSA